MPPPTDPIPVSRRAAALLLFGALLALAWRLDHAAGSEDSDGDGPGFRLTEVSSSLGIDFRHRAPSLDPAIANIEPHVAALGASVAVTDADGDGWPDLYVTSSAFGADNALYVNAGDGTFRDVAAEAGLEGRNAPGEGVSMGSIWGDVDNDGDDDVYLYKWGRGRLFRNDGGLRFTDVTEGAGLPAWTNANNASWIDFDRDGLLDLFVANYFHERFDLWNLETTRIMQESFEFAENGGSNRLLRNLGGLRFEDVTEAVGMDSTRWTMASAAADFDGDGWIDLYTANDYGPEELWRNVEGRAFELVTDARLGDDSKSGMCVALGDVQNEGRLAVYVTNISKEGFLFQGNNLRLCYLDRGSGFVNVADGKVADCGWAWGAQIGDLDNDGWQDVFVANGFISASRDRDYWYGMSKVAGGAGLLFEDARNWPPIEDRSLSGYEQSRVLHNVEGRGWRDVASAVGVEDRFDGRAVAFVDLFRRGVLDVVVANQKGPLLVYRNEVVPGRHWIALELEGVQSNRSAIGALVEVAFTLDGTPRRQLRVVDGGMGFASQNGRAVHVGLGRAERVDEVVVRWPSGRVQTLEGPAVDTRHTVREEDA